MNQLAHYSIVWGVCRRFRASDLMTAASCAGARSIVTSREPCLNGADDQVHELLQVVVSGWPEEGMAHETLFGLLLHQAQRITVARLIALQRVGEIFDQCIDLSMLVLLAEWQIFAVPRGRTGSARQTAEFGQGVLGRTGQKYGWETFDRNDCNDI